MENTKIFVDGMRFELPAEQVKVKAPWIKGKISVKVPDLINFLEKHQNQSGWLNIDLKKSDKSGKYYLELNNWKPKEKIIDPTDGRVLSENPFEN